MNTKLFNLKVILVLLMVCTALVFYGLIMSNKQKLALFTQDYEDSERTRKALEEKRTELKVELNLVRSDSYVKNSARRKGFIDKQDVVYHFQYFEDTIAPSTEQVQEQTSLTEAEEGE